MTTGGWIFMILAWGMIIGVMAFCYTKVMRDRDDQPFDTTDFTD